MTQLEKRVNEELNALLEGKNLNKVLWQKGFQGEQGAPSAGYLVKNGYLTQEAVDYVEEAEDTFHSFYYKWEYDVRQYLLSGQDEDFNEEIVGLDEEEIEDIINESMDCEGWVFVGFTNLVAEVVGEIMSEIKHEQFQKDYQEYKTKLQTIEGMNVDDSFVYDDFGYESVNGFSVYTIEDDEWANPYIDSYIEWTEDRGWRYVACIGNEIGNKKRCEFDNIDDIIGFFKTTINELTSV